MGLRLAMALSCSSDPSLSMMYGRSVVEVATNAPERSMIKLCPDRPIFSPFRNLLISESAKSLANIACSLPFSSYRGWAAVMPRDGGSKNG